ncbi:MAG TPA: hypothetical protein VJ866_09160 [Pyrinomonadaceae bacterium]|nr:hypothetical protein [Pyrinomonadaceae bacterium]
MPSAVAERRKVEGEARGGGSRGVRRALAAVWGRAAVRELAIVFAFCLLTAILTWPYVTRMRDAVVDSGDPYLISWIMWWDYHQTFRDPLNLFHSNTFYPLRYTLAFSEHCYGLALLFFPLYALGLRPLTVLVVSEFFGFALSGYAAFRLARTLTGSRGVAWVAGIVFAFVPFRFHLMSQAMYVFSAWIPLLFEALVLFARRRTRGRAAWLGVAFFMLGLTTVSWFALALVPFGLAWALLATRHRLWREGVFWRRGLVSLGLAALALLPFMAPYFIVSKLYGFKRTIQEVKDNSAWPVHWLSVERRNKLWNGMGAGLPQGDKHKLFPGLLPLLFSLAALVLVEPARRMFGGGAADVDEGRREGASRDVWAERRRWVRRLDALVIVAFAVSLLAVGFDDTDKFGGLFRYVTSERALSLFTAALVTRLCLAYPALLRAANANFVETLRSERRDDLFWLGIMLSAVGFCYSLGWNFFFYRICYDLLPVFRSMRVPTRGAMFAYLGLALLAGAGVRRLAALISERRSRIKPAAVYAAACALLLIELNGAPLDFMRGAVFPDAVTQRLKQTEMRGGIVILPAGPDYNHEYMLRAADHGKPLIVGTSGFNSPQEDQIEHWTAAGTIPTGLLNLLEQIPASYVVVKNARIGPERKQDYAAFLARGVASGRLRFINRFDGTDDLYAVVKTEPGARPEASPPPELELRDWATLIGEDPVNLLGQYAPWAQALYRVRLVERGGMPRYGEFMQDAAELGRGLIPGSEAAEADFQTRLRALASGAEVRARYAELGDAQFVARLYENAGVASDPSEREALVAALSDGSTTRADVLLRLAEDPRLVERERNRSLLLLHYFGFLRRNPDDPPDHGLEGFDFWLAQMSAAPDGPDKIALAFRDSIEYKRMKGIDK